MFDLATVSPDSSADSFTSSFSHDNASPQLQFYPTPPALALRAWKLFTNRDFHLGRVLEPSAGRGDLVRVAVDVSRHLSWSHVDCAEIDLAHHDALRALRANVVGLDFLQMTRLERYTHIIMNPPFAQGAQHLLHAWKHLYDGEIVCILNAETLRNPYSRERRELAAIIEQHGSFELIAGAFAGPDSERKSDVEVALVYLKKTAQTDDLIASIIGGLKEGEGVESASEGIDFTHLQTLALPEGFIERQVKLYDAAVRSAKAAAQATAVADYYEQRLRAEAFSGSLHALQADEIAKARAVLPSEVRKELALRADKMRELAWRGVLSSSEFENKLTQKRREELRSEFERITKLDFTASNIYSFLVGLCESQDRMQGDCILDVFDLFSRYHEENVVYYMGWKSNTKHRTLGMRLKQSRIILPMSSAEDWQCTAPYKMRETLLDIDKAFALLDGKNPERVYGLGNLFHAQFVALKRGERLASEYFDVRYYAGRGTVHLYPKSKEVMDRMNRFVGKHRAWLPPNDADMGRHFAQQYERAEKYNAELLQQVQKACEASGSTRSRYWREDSFGLNLPYSCSQPSEATNQLLAQAVHTAIEATAAKVGIDLTQMDAERALQYGGKQATVSQSTLQLELA